MAAKQLNLIQGSEQWHSWRLTGLGASDIPAILGVSPYKTTRDLAFEKAGLGEPDDEDRSYIYQRGHEAEAELREMFSKHTKLEINPTCFQNGIFLASLDGYNKELGILEAKLVGKDVLKKVAEGVIPEHHRIQVQSQLYSSESDKAFYGAKAPKVKGGCVVEIGRDEKLIKKILDEGEKFWDNIKAGKLPPLSARDTLFITEPEQVAVFQRLIELRKQLEPLEAAYTEVEQLAKSFAVHPKVRYESVTISQSERAGAIDYSRIPEIKALSEDYLDSFRRKSSFVKTLRFGKGE